MTQELLHCPKTLIEARDMIARKQSYCAVVGVYVLFMGDAIIYVGQSTNVSARISTHAVRGPFSFDSFFVHECAKDDLKSLEAKYIHAHRPAANIHVPGRKEPFLGKRRMKKHGFAVYGASGS